MPKVASNWKYYLPDQGETVEDASPLHHYAFNKIFDVADAAKYAAEDEWFERGGDARDFFVQIRIIVVAPDTLETTFMCETELDMWQEAYSVDFITTRAGSEVE